MNYKKILKHSHTETSYILMFTIKDRNDLYLLKLTAFPHYPERGSPCNFKGNFDHFQSPLQMKQKNVIKPLTARTQARGTNLDFQKEQHIYKRISDGTIINLKRAWEKLLLAVCAIVTIKTTADFSIMVSRNTGQWAVSLELLPSLATWFLESSPNRSKGAFQEQWLLVVMIPKLTTQPPTGIP